MSLILDALKKLDREKKSSRRSETTRIAVEILRPDLPRPGKRILRYFSAVSLAAIVAAAITYSVMGGLGRQPQSLPPMPVTPAIPQQVAPPTSQAESMMKPYPPAPMPPSKPAQRVRPAPPSESGSLTKLSPPPLVSPTAPNQQVTLPLRQAEPPTKLSPPASVHPPTPAQQVVSPPPSEQARDARGEISRVPPKTTNLLESNKPPASPIEKKESRPVISGEGKATPKTAKKPAELTPKESGATPPSLKLSGILWHENPSERRAVINSMVLPEGSVIEGVKVLEINPTRVRLSHDGRSFEISMFP
jgi:hypothetical protein